MAGRWVCDGSWRWCDNRRCGGWRSWQNDMRCGGWRRSLVSEQKVEHNKCNSTSAHAKEQGKRNSAAQHCGRRKHSIGNMCNPKAMGAPNLQEQALEATCANFLMLNLYIKNLSQNGYGCNRIAYEF